MEEQWMSGWGLVGSGKGSGRFLEEQWMFGRDLVLVWAGLGWAVGAW